MGRYLALLLLLSMPVGAEQLTHDGIVRDYTIAAPPHENITRKLPLVLVLHGAGGTGRYALNTYHWGDRAVADGFIAVAPNALPPRLNEPARFRDNPAYWNDLSGRGAVAHHTIDDVGFIAAVIDAVSGAYPVDPARIYVTGFSSGASMAHLLGMRLSNRLAAIAPVAGRNWIAEAPTTRLPVLLIYGDSDPLHPFHGGRPRTPWGDGPLETPIDDIATTWAGLLDCPVTATNDTPAPHLRRRTWTGCGAGSDLTYLVVEGLGHHWSQGKRDGLPETVAGPNSAALNTTETIWQFFRAHPKASR